MGNTNSGYFILTRSVAQHDTIARRASFEVCNGLVDLGKAEVLGHRLDFVPRGKFEHFADGFRAAYR